MNILNLIREKSHQYFNQNIFQNQKFENIVALLDKNYKIKVSSSFQATRLYYNQRQNQQAYFQIRLTQMLQTIQN